MAFEDFSSGIITKLKEINAHYQFFEHKPFLTHKKIKALAKQLDFQGEELKSLVVCDKKSRHFYLVVTIAEKQINFAQIAEILGERKIKMASEDQVLEIAKAFPNGVSPFGFSDEIKILVDEEIFAKDFLLFHGGAPNNTIQIASKDFRRVYEDLLNEVIFALL